MEDLATALKRAGISDPRLFKIRSNYCIAVENENSVTEEQGKDSEEVRGDENVVKSEKEELLAMPKRPLVYSLRAAHPYDNRFVYVEEGPGRQLKLRLGHTDPRKEELGLFWKMVKFCESRMDFVYTFTNLKYNKSIGVNMEPSPTVTLLSPPTSPLCGPDPRVFVEQGTSRPDSFLLQPTVCPVLHLTYNVVGEITLSKAGSPFTERDGTPACSAENDRTDQLWNLSGQPKERTRSLIVSEYE